MHTAPEAKAVPNGKFSFFQRFPRPWYVLRQASGTKNRDYSSSFLIISRAPSHPLLSFMCFFWSITEITTVTKFPAGSPTIVGCLHCIGSKVLATWHANSDFLSCPKGRVLPKAQKRHLLFSRRRWRPARRAACSTTQGTKSKRLVVCRFAPCE